MIREHVLLNEDISVDHIICISFRIIGSTLCPACVGLTMLYLSDEGQSR